LFGRAASRAGLQIEAIVSVGLFAPKDGGAQPMSRCRPGRPSFEASDDGSLKLYGEWAVFGTSSGEKFCCMGGTTVAS
jgi:hypothetical protein